MEYKFSKYSNVFSEDKIDIDLNQYITIVKTGLNQDLVISARACKQKGDEDGYKKLKSKSMAILGSAVMNNGAKVASNIAYLNGLIVIDIDDFLTNDQINALKNDRYSFLLHRSFGGQGICIFVKIDSDKFKESFEGLAEYYLKNFAVKIDISCSNPNRLRYISYDPDLFYNVNSARFVAKKKIKEIKEQKIVYTDSDFDAILNQIKARRIDLCEDSYHKYMRIGFSIYDQFGASGEGHFKFICSFGSKYDEAAVSKHYQNFSKNGSVTIATLYHYCKDAGIEIYTKQTKETINAVKLHKTQGNATIEGVVKHLQEVNEIEEPDTKLIEQLINSSFDYSKGVTTDESDLAQIERFILDNYKPRTNTLTNETFIKNDVRLDDKQLNDIYISAKKFFSFTVSKTDVRDIINSNSVIHFDPVKEYFDANNEIPTNEIEQYISCIHPQNDYNVWAFKKWLVGCIHNWLAPLEEPKVSPLTLVLCGQKQGTGKTSFFRELLPSELKIYMAEAKIDIENKDSIFNLTKNLIVMDDEFGGLAMRDVKDFKKVADTNIIDMRLPYAAIYSKFKRRASLAGTSNESNILKDVTGNRRILPIMVERIDYDRMLSINKDALLKQAYNAFKDGSIDWKIYKDEDVEYLKEQTNHNIDVMPVEELFFKFFSIVEKDDFTIRRVFNQGEILDYLNIHTSIKPTKYDIKDIFTKNKLEYRSLRDEISVKWGVYLYVKPENLQLNGGVVPF